MNTDSEKRTMKILYMFFIIILMFGLVYNVLGNSEEKESLTNCLRILLKNMPTTNYDLFVYDENGTEFGKKIKNSEFDYSIIMHRLYNLRKFRVVIINNDTDETKMTELIEKNGYFDTVELDASNMMVKKIINTSRLKEDARLLIKLIAVLIITKLIISFFFIERKGKNILLIIITSIFSSIIFIIPILGFIGGLVLETIVYKIFMLDTSRKKIRNYIIVANIMSIIMTFLVGSAYVLK